MKLAGGVAAVAAGNCCVELLRPPVLPPTPPPNSNLLTSRQPDSSSIHGGHQVSCSPNAAAAACVTSWRPIAAAPSAAGAVGAPASAPAPAGADTAPAERLSAAAGGARGAALKVNTPFAFAACCLAAAALRVRLTLKVGPRRVNGLLYGLPLPLPLSEAVLRLLPPLACACGAQQLCCCW